MGAEKDKLAAEGRSWGKMEQRASDERVSWALAQPREVSCLRSPCWSISS